MSKKEKKKKHEIGKVKEDAPENGYVGQGMYAEPRECLCHLSRDYIISQLIAGDHLDGHTVKELHKSVLVMPSILPERENEEGNIYIVSIKDGNVNGVAEIFSEFIPAIAAGLHQVAMNMEAMRVGKKS